MNHFVYQIIERVYTSVYQRYSPSLELIAKTVLYSIFLSCYHATWSQVPLGKIFWLSIAL